MAPEQLGGKEATGRSDIYALGLILFEMFTGRRPFDGRDQDELRELRATTPVPHPSNTVVGLAPSIERTILRCLEVDPRARPSSALSVASSLVGKDTASRSTTSGETSSPAEVQPVGSAAGLHRSVAFALLVFTVLGMPLVAIWGNHIGWLSRRQPGASPEILAHQARQLAISLGYGDPVDSSWGFVSPRVLGTFTNRSVEFWYRQANCVFQPDRILPAGTGSILLGSVDAENPRYACPGDVNLFFDLDGKLVGLQGIPPAAPLPGTPDWSKVFSASGLDPANVRPIQPGRQPALVLDAQNA
jgi:serine/threonine-protein kinase